VGFKLVFLYDCVYLVSDFWLFEVSEGSDALGVGTEAGTGEAGGVDEVSLSLMFEEFVFYAPLYETFHIFPGL
jgi:hypothetical protein